MKSMTGYGHAELHTGDRDLTVDLRSVNNRYLDVSVSVPSFLAPLEQEIKARVARHAHRGKVDLYLRLREYSSDVVVHVDRGAVAAAREALAEIASHAGISAEPGYRDILAFEGVIQTETRRDPESFRDDVFTAVDQALEQWDASRRTEGIATRDDITHHLDRLRESLDVFAAAAPQVEARILETVRSRFREVLGNEADEQRIYAEAAMLMVKHATGEEVSRLRGHIQSFAEILEEDGAIGKRLDFVCQEMNREINTTGSKTILSDVQNAVVDAKDAVEAIREQIRNVE